MAIRPIKIFYCYAHEDDALRKQLADHLSPLRRLRDITGWFDRDIQAGAEWERKSEEQLNAANIILLLISADFMASDYCYTVEMTRALERHRAGTARVIPILLRPVAWEGMPLGELSPLPTNRIPVTQWANPDAALLSIVQGISDIVRKLLPKQLLSLQDTDILYAEQGPLSGQTIGEKYLLSELIGEGGFSQVYKAQHLQIQRQQAVKVLLERHFRKPEFRDRFLREARTVASLDHPNIIHLDDFWVEASQACLVMPYMSGGTLQSLLEKQQGFLELDQTVFYLEHICAALDYAHKQGIAHLDLKPLNLLVHTDGRLLLSDFGLAHLMKDGAVAGGSSLRVGTPHYMAPEHIKGFPERRSDLFSLGVMLYKMLVGRLPFDGLPHETILMKNMIEWPAAPRVLRPELPQAVEDILARALAKQPVQRYQTASEFLVAFKDALVSSSYMIVPQHSQKNNDPNTLYVKHQPLILKDVSLNDYIDPRPYILPSVRDKCREGDQFLRMQRYSQALEAYEEALRLDPRNFYAWNGKGTALYNQGNYRKALEAYQRATEIDPENAVVWVSAGLVLNRLQRYQQALVHFERALNINPHYVAAWNGKADAQLDMNMPEEAHASYAQALAYDAASFQAWNGLGNARSSLRDYSGAVDPYTRALLVNSRSAVAWCNKAEALMHLGHNRAALDALNEATEMDKSYIRAWTLKAEVYASLGNPQEAQEAQEGARELFDILLRPRYTQNET